MFIAVKICLEDPQSQIIDAQENTKELSQEHGGKHKQTHKITLSRDHKKKISQDFEKMLFVCFLG